MNKIRISNEWIYVFAVIILSFATAMLATADMGMSMVVAPAYIVSIKVPFLTFGQAEYIVQGILFVIFCILMKKVKVMYFFAFLSGFIYGAVLDMWRMMIPHFNPELYPPGTLPMPVRVVYFIIGFFLNSLGVALYFKTYFYPQVYEFFVKGISARYGIELEKFKRGFDLCFLGIALILSLAVFHRIVGIGVGTIVLACCNGPLIGWYGRQFDRKFDTCTVWTKFSQKFD